MPKHQTMTIEEFLGISGKPKKHKRQPDKSPAKETVSSQANGTQVQIWLPKLSRATHPNVMGHWRKKHKAKAAQKELAWAVAKEAMGLASPWKEAIVEIIYFTTAKCDRDGIIAWCKSSLDGLQGVVIEDDSGFLFPSVIIERVSASDSRRGGLLLNIRKTK